jgi:hypothetical protein
LKNFPDNGEFQFSNNLFSKEKEHYFVVDKYNNVIFESLTSEGATEFNLNMTERTGEKFDVYLGSKLAEEMRTRNFKKRYKKGGLVDYTGPAWVDGTPTSPEAFLSANDTRNIQTLTEILQDVLVPASPSPTEKTAIKSGDTNIEIHLEVGEISDDYDVNQMLDQIQERISEASEGQVTIVR